jgi:hypothetical protein
MGLRTKNMAYSHIRLSLPPAQQEAQDHCLVIKHLGMSLYCVDLKQFVHPKISRCILTRTNACNLIAILLCC